MLRKPHPGVQRGAPFRGARKAWSSDGPFTPGELASFLGSRHGASGGGGPANAYAAVSTVYACVRKKADAFAMTPLRVSNLDDQVLENGPLVQLLERPNPNLTGRAARRAIAGFRACDGVVHIVKDQASETSPVRAWKPVSTHEMHEQPDGRWLYTPILRHGRRHESVTLEAWQVHTIVDPDFGAGDLANPLSPRHAAALAIRQHFKADRANDASLDNGGGGGLGLRSEHNLTEPQRDKLERVIDDKHTGYLNRHRWMLLEGLSVEKLYESFADMQFVELKYYAREDICVAFGLSPMVLGYGGREGLGSGKEADSQHLMAWQDTHLPEAEWIAEEICDALSPSIDRDASLRIRDCRRRAMVEHEAKLRVRRAARARAVGLDRRYYLWPDVSGIAVLQRYNAELAKQGESWVEKGVPLNDVNDAFDLPFPKVPWGKTWWKPVGLSDVQADHAPGHHPEIDDPPGPPPEPPEPPEDNPAPEDPQQNGLGRGAYGGDSGGAEKRVSEAQLAALWEQWRLSWDGLYRQARSRSEAHFRALRGETLANLARVLGPPQKAVNVPAMGDARRKDVVAEILFDLVEANRSLRVRVGPLLREATRLGGQQSMDEAAQAQGIEAEDSGDSGGGEGFNIADPAVEQAMVRREVELTGVNRTLRLRVRDVLVEGITQQQTTQQIGEAIRQEFKVAGKRAQTIARTEVGRSVEEARHLGRIQARVPLKSWLWSRKETGRRHHAETERLTLENPIPNEQDFRLAQSGHTCPHPRATGVPAEDINCGCTTLARYEGDSIRQVVGRYLQRGFLTDRQLASRPRNAGEQRQPRKDAA